MIMLRSQISRGAYSLSMGKGECFSGEEASWWENGKFLAVLYTGNLKLERVPVSNASDINWDDAVLNK